ncbi:Hypothetical protein GbCGDNIH1_2155 [Granulibacter bethesdensis CGDNIH1]|uniref:Uncharacterized protein n=1 Tax=Granulibacter bethesdensis (strain ATCC BAA-1260 / CGDNIH1) TaxID=391165 RepID=Q0BQ49_GRABC|nr:Hypothetical protein GbCGDNIH1_2155 [Granulibacter bethesdensis CGDNIH1]APH52926.1 Hypothetical protein GbCGDNIH5_2155 [Granulibacter bethesdensis]APH65614.1 Hypothetical protein GbCGDNIH1I4_2155 [Granulibacter bethesdensis]
MMALCRSRRNIKLFSRANFFRFCWLSILKLFSYKYKNFIYLNNILSGFFQIKLLLME